MADDLKLNAQIMEQSRLDSDPAYALRAEQAASEQGFLDNMYDAMQDTALSKVGSKFLEEVRARVEEDTGVPSNGSYSMLRSVGGASQKNLDTMAATTKATVGTLFGVSRVDPKWDKGAALPELIKGIPVEYWDDIKQHNNPEGAQRERARIMANLKRDRTMMMQTTASATLAHVLGGMIDVDLPLALVSGGAITGAKVARTAYKASRAVGFGPSSALRVGSLAQGVAAGAEAAATVSVAESWADPTLTWQDATMSVLTGATLGGGIGMFTKSSARQAIRGMQDDLAKNTAVINKIDDDVDTRAGHGYFDMAGTPDNTPGPSGSSTTGAATVNPVYAQNLNNPFHTSTAPEVSSIIQNAHQWTVSHGLDDEIEALENSVWGKLVTGRLGKNAVLAKTLGRVANATGSDVMRFFKTKSSVMRMLGANIFENPSSFGRGVVSSSSATLAEVFERRIASTMKGYASTINDWAARSGNTRKVFGQNIPSATREARREMDRKVVLNMNQMNLGKAAPDANDADVMRLTEMLGDHAEEALTTMKGDNPLRTAMKGAENINVDRTYFPQRANGNAINDVIRRGITDRQRVEAAFEAGYLAAGMSPEGAKVTAKATLARAMAGDLDIDTSMVDLLTEDGREFFRQRLSSSGLSPQDQTAIFDALVGQAQYRGQEGFTKHRNQIDMSVVVPSNSGTLQLVDLYYHDVEDVLMGYRRRVSGQSALARKGIRSRMDLDKLIQAAREEMQSLGEEPPDTDWFDAMFSDFFGGPGWGYSSGKLQKGIDAEFGIAKDIAGLSLLGQLGFSQIIDSANIMASAGIRDFFTHAKAFANLDRDLKDVNTGLLDDLEFLYGDIGKDHRMFKEHLGLDELSQKESHAFVKGAQKITHNLKWLQGYTSLFNAVRGKEQELAAISISNKLFKYIKAGEHTDRIKYDLGVDDLLFERLQDLVKSGSIEFKTVNGREFVNRLNGDKWDSFTKDGFSSVMIRAQNMLVQKNMPGETDLWMRKNWASMLVNLKMFPITAVPKQMMRNARFMDTETVGVAAYGMGVAYLAMAVRDTINGKESTVEERARQAFAYSNMFGWVPMVTDPALTMLGLDDYRIQRYGRHYEMTIPAVDVANRLIRAPGAAITAVTGGSLNSDDKQALLAIPFMRTMGIGQWLIN